MNTVKEIFKKYDDEISRLQYKKFTPTSTLEMNDVNNKIIFWLDLENLFISKNIQYYIAGEFKLTDAIKSYNNKINIKMTDNFVAHLISHIEVTKHNTIIDEIDYPGIVSTVEGCVEYPGLNIYNGKPITSGFRSHNYKGSQFEAVGNLSSLWLDFFNDITVPIYRGGFKILFTRNGDNNVIYRWKTNKADGTEDAAILPTEGKITIKTFYLRIPIIEYNSESQIMLIKELLQDSYFFQFKKWKCIQKMKASRKTLDIDITNMYRNVTKPIRAFVLQTNRSNKQLKDNSIFDHSNINNLWLEDGGKRYPEEFWNLDFENNYYVSAYEAFQDFKKCFFKTDSIPYVDKKRVQIYVSNIQCWLINP